MINVEHIFKKLEGHDDAIQFLCFYNDYINSIDDCIDEPYSIDTIDQTAQYASKVHNCAYWQKYSNLLIVVDRLIHNSYFDSTKWEESEEEWKKQYAKFLSHAGLNMFLAVLILELGENECKNLSLSLREALYKSK